jgi:ribosome biogenesis GTPase A
MKTGKHWQEIYKVILTDINVVMEVIDARNPIGTHNHAIETFIKKNKPEIRLILILNKSDIIPKNVLKEWMKYFKELNYEIYSVSSKYKSGIDTLFHKLRIYSKGTNLNILTVGYPNTGKSTLIQSLTKDEKKLGISASAGFTRGIQKIKLSQNIYLVDSPGIIPFEELNETEIAIKACMTADKIEDSLSVVEAIYKLISRSQFNKKYHIKLAKSDGVEELIEKIGLKLGFLSSGGRVNRPNVEKTIIRDWQANKLHYFVLPPSLQTKKPIEDLPVDKFPKKSFSSQTKSMPKSLNRRKKKQ